MKKLLLLLVGRFAEVTGRSFVKQGIYCKSIDNLSGGRKQNLQKHKNLFFYKKI